jgi:carbon-monoxide dehydrogenase medium subunit
MKPAPFDYQAPGSLPAALELLGSDGAIPLAGGQSLVPMLNMRLARPALLVDLNGIPELARVCVEGGALRVGAVTRQLALERSREVRSGWPLLEQAVRCVGHVAIRARGTVGGSAAHADPQAELPAALLALRARFHLRSSRGERTVAAEDFLRSPFRAALEPGELLTEIELPPLPSGARTAFAERARTHGAFAVAGAAVVLVPGGPCAIALLGAGPVPIRARCAEDALSAGAPPDEVAALAASGVRDDHRRALVAALVAQALVSAVRE